ncbi:hypothetical protein P3T23_009465 [Paraburkholderia sp. GAS448]
MPSTDDWTEINPYALSHPDGWLISRYCVNGSDLFLLWDPDGKCRGRFRRIPSARRAFRRLAPCLTPRLYERSKRVEADAGLPADPSSVSAGHDSAPMAQPADIPCPMDSSPAR